MATHNTDGDSMPTGRPRRHAPRLAFKPASSFKVPASKDLTNSLLTVGTQQFTEDWNHLHAFTCGSSKVLYGYESLFNSHVWFDEAIQTTIVDFNSQDHEKQYLDGILCGRTVTTCGCLPIDAPVLQNTESWQSEIKDDVSSNYVAAAQALWKDSVSGQDLDDNALASLYHTIQHGKGLCKLNPNDHLFMTYESEIISG